MTDHSERVTREDPREHTSAPATDVPNDVFMAAKDAAYGVLSYLDMEWTAHRPIQGDATPKVIAYWVAAAVCKALAAEPVVEPTPVPTCDRPGAEHRISELDGRVEHRLPDGTAYDDLGTWRLCPAESARVEQNSETTLRYDWNGSSELVVGAISAPTGPTEAHQHEIRFVIDCAACIQELSDDLDRRSTTHRDETKEV